MASSKKCFKCGTAKSLDDFYKHPRMADGRLGKCKECTKKDVKENRLKNIDYYRQYDIDRSKEPERRALSVEVSKAWRAEDSRRATCHSALRRAVLSGLIKRMPCATCGSSKSMAHHESYDRPLDVVWYCQPCHSDRHKTMKIKGIVP